jgi:alkanesulfonate monooxygenase SsuD/methylene tetrahydromethanopterin reductase-like flavin-dependent oxidoreductase (luciferase family)
LLLAASEYYRENFRPSATLREAYLMVAAPVVVAETDAEAKRLFTTSQQRFLRLIRNQPVELFPPVDSMETIWQPWEREIVANKLGEAVVGSEEIVHSGLEDLIRRTGANEIIAVTDTYEHAARLESCRRLARVAKTIDNDVLRAVRN